MNFNANISSVRAGTISADFFVGRGSQAALPKKSFGQKLAAISPASSGHAKYLLQTRGLSASGAEELMSGVRPLNPVDQRNRASWVFEAATQMESRKFTTLSNASKARHDIALNAIRNMK